MDRIPNPVAFVGGGTMARAIAAGALDAGLLDPSAVCAADPDAGAREWFASHGCAAFDDGAGALEWLARVEPACGNGVLLLAVKPQALDRAAASIVPALAGMPRLVVSILAGTTTERIGVALGGSVRVVRAMPNTPARARKGITAIAPGTSATADDASLAERLFGAVGRVVRIDEALMDAFTAVAGSGPAYVFLLAEAMVEGAVESGLDRETALLAVRATVAGAGALLESGEDEPAALRAAVTSKGGTTAAALGVLESERVREALVRAVVAARDRGRELASGA
ncbi:MAG: pyrroline-5-carboxylate reductase [Phycisphaeraceae bacterium]|nr:pyrroline-5-carboxylate reductase [Phycisphaeraceae bacterium]